MKKKRFLIGLLAFIVVFGMTVIGCDDGSKGKTYYYEAFKISMAQYNNFISGTTPGYNYTFSQIQGFRQTLRSLNGTFISSGTGATEAELRDFMTSSGISTSEYNQAKKSLDEVGNMIYFFQDQQSNVIWFYFEKE